MSIKAASIVREAIAPIALSVGLVWLALAFWRGSLSVPVIYHGDTFVFARIIKTVLAFGWDVENPQLGAPFAADHYDFPMPEAASFLLIRCLGLLSDNFAVVHNLFFFLSFGMVAVTAHFALRALDIRYALALSGALVYALLPYHFLRLEHVLLASYFVVPIAAFVAVRVYSKPPETRREWALLALASVVCGVTGVYYAFIGALMIGSAGALAALAQRSARRFWIGCVFALIVAGAMSANLIPSLVYSAAQGRNPVVAERAAFESELYGLRISQMLLPMEDHRVRRAARIAEEYGRSVNVSPESKSSYLGLVGVAGFITLLVCALLPEGASAAVPRIVVLARLNLVVLLFSTIGAFGTLFALVVSPQIRALNRFSVVIAFLSIAGLMLLAEAGVKRLEQRDRRRHAGIAIAVLLLAVAIFDQTSLRFVPPYEELRREFENDARFVERIENSLPRGSMVYQLPYVSYPESLPAHKEGFYGMMRGYLHSRELRWSYGAMRGRLADIWQQAVAAMPMRARLQVVAESGFRGVYVDRRGYADNGAGVERELKKVVAGAPIESEDRQLVFYPITPTGDRPDAVAPQLQLAGGFHAWESGPTGSRSVWTKGDAKLNVYNFSAQPVKVDLSFAAATLVPRTFTVRAPSVSPLVFRLQPGTDRAVSLEFMLAPGANAVRLETVEPAAVPGTQEIRKLAVLLRNPRLVAVP